MAKIGLALSGGGFRGTLFHLGAIRFLHDAHLLRDISHITAVSGGSILAAHLVLNWESYNGSDEEFNEVSQKILDFVRLDVRNRIVRRFPFVALGSALRWITRRPYDRRFSRTGLLERYYSKYLYGATCLYELPDYPELHLLSTNLSEGCICSFTRSGLIMQRRLPGDRVAFERIQAGLATVPLAVAASSAFPAFFPPIRLKAADIGANLIAFSQQTFTDGGVFDNLGVRAFRFIEHCWSEECRPTGGVGREMEVEAIGARSGSHAKSTHADAERQAGHYSDDDDSASAFRGDDPDPNDHHSESETPGFLGPPGPENLGGRRDGRSSGPLSRFDAVLVSDAGAKLATHHNTFSGGIVRTAVRASDILMDRVWQLEKEIFGATPQFLFVPIHRVVELEEDPHALQPVVQRQVIGIRTDLDRFSPTEIRTLVQHGYEVMRQVCRSHPELFGQSLPTGEPWDPLPTPKPTVSIPPGRPDRPPAPTTIQARELQQSAVRRIVSTLVDWRDGMTYVFLPLVIAVVLAFPALLLWSYSHISRDERALAAIASTDPDEMKVIELLRDGPIGALEGMAVRDVDRLEPPDYRGFNIITDGHIVDFRSRDLIHSSFPASRASHLYQYRRLLVRKLQVDGADEHLRLQFSTKAITFAFRCNNPGLSPVLKRMQQAPANDGAAASRYRLELDLDFTKVPANTTVDVIVDGAIQHEGDGATKQILHPVPHTSYGDTKLATIWIILPNRRNAGRLQVISYPTDRPQEKREAYPTREFVSTRKNLVGWQIVGPAPDTTYESYWVLE
jgi:hypothetical protein